jgi:hypothetical protein
VNLDEALLLLFWLGFAANTNSTQEAGDSSRWASVREESSLKTSSAAVHTSAAFMPAASRYQSIIRNSEEEARSHSRSNPGQLNS